MCDFFRKNVQEGAQMRIWVEPVDSDDRPFNSTARLRDSDQMLLWDDVDITQTSRANPLVIDLSGAEKFIGSARTIFAGTVSARVINEVWVFENNEWRSHGNRKICVVSPSTTVSVADVFIYIRMA